MVEGDLQQSLPGLLAAAEARGYGVPDLRRISDAYWRALPLYNAGYRGCGRPFINHCVGTASALVHYGFETRLVEAALLHAAYTHAPRGEGGPKAEIAAVTTRLGGADNAVEKLVRAYTLREARWKRLSESADFQDRVWQDGDKPKSNFMQVHVSRLKSKLRALRGARIETVAGRGYRLVEGDE